MLASQVPGLKTDQQKILRKVTASKLFCAISEDNTTGFRETDNQMR
jgi:hypothetical protein